MSTTTANPPSESEINEASLSIIEKNSFTQSTRNLSKGLWISNLNRVKLERAKGKFLHHVGYVSDYASEQKTENEKLVKYDFLYPEEAIYLLENSNLIVHLNLKESLLKIPLSIQQCYELFFRLKSYDIDENNDQSNLNLDLNCYKIYSNLVKNSFIVRRAHSKKTKPLKDEKLPDEKIAKSLIKLGEEESKNSDIMPIVDRSEHGKLTQLEVYNRLNSLIPNITLDELRGKLNENVDYKRPKFEHVFDVNKPDKRFQKSMPPNPDFNIFTVATKSDGQLFLPSIGDFVRNSEHKTQIYAFADESNNPLYYTFNFNFSLPFIVKD